MQFLSLVRSLSIDTPDVEERPCPDQYVGNSQNLDLNGSTSLRRPATDRPDEPSLLVVLESPHVEEFKSDPAPAMGSTGRLISKHLKEVAGLGPDEDRPVLLINAIQHQCSLGRRPTCFRDRVFAAVWAGGGREDFVSRLSVLMRPGDVILCCCTKGGTAQPSQQLRQLVYNAIVESFPLARVLRRTHPASWHSRTNRRYEWTAA